MNYTAGRVPQLDAARFAAFLLVFLHHFINQISWPEIIKQHLSVGIIGLDYFFVLSGFILCQRYLCISGRNRPSAREYLLRRIGRTWPMYFLWFLIALVYHTIPSANSQTGSLVHWLSFSLNFEMIGGSQQFWFPVGVLWSICVEEQLYLLIFILILFPRLTIPLSLFMIVSSVAFRWISKGDDLYFNSLSYAGNFGLGLMLPFLSEKLRKYYSSYHVASIAWVLLFMGIMMYPVWFVNGLGLVFERLYFSVLFAFIILNWQNNQESLFRWEKIRWLPELGKMSLGLYLYHTIAIVLTFKLIKPESFAQFLCAFSLSMGMTILVSALSFRFFEAPLNSRIRSLWRMKC